MSTWCFCARMLEILAALSKSKVNIDGVDLPILIITVLTETSQRRSRVTRNYHDLIAQWLEHLPGKEKTMGSIPVAGCKFCNRMTICHLCSIEFNVLDTKEA
jgi:hypothetical protein